MEKKHKAAIFSVWVSFKGVHLNRSPRQGTPGFIKLLGTTELNGGKTHGEA